MCSHDEEVIEKVESAFTDLQTKNVQMPPIMRIDIPENNGEVDIKTAYIPGYEMFALKVSSGFFNNYKNRSSKYRRINDFNKCFKRST